MRLASPRLYANAGESINKLAQDLEEIKAFAGDSRELALARTKLEEAAMWLVQDRNVRELDRIRDDGRD